jgi:hypothetical protein
MLLAGRETTTVLKMNKHLLKQLKTHDQFIVFNNNEHAEKDRIKSNFMGHLLTTTMEAKHHAIAGRIEARI